VPLIGSFRLADWIVVIAYLAAMAALGFYFSRRQSSLDRYLLAERNMGWLPVGLSLMAALNSGMDYLMQPSSTIRYGIVLTMGVLSWVVLYPWIARVVFPFYNRLDFYTVYEFLEARFDVRVRTLAAAISSCGAWAGRRPRCSCRAWPSTPSPRVRCRSTPRRSSSASSSPSPRWPAASRE
jgi:Na+/proline symporter